MALVLPVGVYSTMKFFVVILFCFETASCYVVQVALNSIMYPRLASNSICSPGWSLTQRDPPVHATIFGFLGFETGSPYVVPVGLEFCDPPNSAS